VGETRVELLHLLEDLRDAYPGSLEETIVSEIVANSLDSRAAMVVLTADPGGRTLCVVDDGSGMTRGELRRYHDLAASGKTRGSGIGFAGVGIKLGLLACEEVLTETRRGKAHVATTWRLASRHRAPWSWLPPPGLVPERGTAVRLTLANGLSPLLDPAFLRTVLQTHFAPLLDAAFQAILAAHYPRGVRFVVQGVPLEAPPWSGERVSVAVRLARRRNPSGIGFLERHAQPLPEGRRGLAVSTLGKVIKRGWDWVGRSPAHLERVGGLVEIPALAASLTLSKGDFLRTGPRGAAFLAHRKAVQEAVAAQLATWGEARDAQDARRPRTGRIERALQTVLADLAEEFPLLTALVDWRRGGQRRLLIAGSGAGAAAAGRVVVPVAAVAEGEVVPPPPSIASPERELAAPRPAPASALPPPTAGPKRPVHSGLTIRFGDRPDDAELGRLEDSTVWVNEAHPAFRRAAALRSEDYHVALTVALTLAPLTVEPAGERRFVTAFLARWGEAAERRRPPARRASAR
jgi:hypothetical protein